MVPQKNWDALPPGIMLRRKFQQVSSESRHFKVKLEEGMHSI